MLLTGDGDNRTLPETLSRRCCDRAEMLFDFFALLKNGSHSLNVG
jgi:hypothetical protein